MLQEVDVVVEQNISDVFSTRTVGETLLLRVLEGKQVLHLENRKNKLYCETKLNRQCNHMCVVTKLFFLKANFEGH